MDESILISIKKMLGLTEEYDHFDQDIIIYINSAFMTLKQLNVGPSDGFSINDKTAVWRDFISGGVTTISYDGSSQRAVSLGAIQGYIYTKVKLIFDPPQSSFAIEALNKIANEYEWRLNLEFDKEEVEWCHLVNV